MSGLKSIQMAIALAADRRDHALEHFAKARCALDFGLDQLAQLQSYAADTEKRWIQIAQQATSREVLQCKHHFIGRLQHAIGLQRLAMQSLDADLGATKKALLEAECRLAGLRKVYERKQAAMRQAQTRSEQKQMDEFAAFQQRIVLAGEYHGDLA